jgi:hypothetical protein
MCFDREIYKRLFCAVVVIVAIGSSNSAIADQLRYMDSSGNIIFVDSLNQVPTRYRDQVVPPTPVPAYDRKTAALMKRMQREAEVKKIRAQRDKEREELRQKKLRERELKELEKEIRRRAKEPRRYERIPQRSYSQQQRTLQAPPTRAPNSSLKVTQ